MIRIVASAALLLLSAGCAVPPGSAGAPASAGLVAVEGFTDLFDGVRYHTIRRQTSPSLVAHVVEIDLAIADAVFVTTQGDDPGGAEYRARTTSAFAADSGADIALNASYFLPFSGGSRGGDDFYPQTGDAANASGAALSGGRTVSPAETGIDDRVTAIICFFGERVQIRDGQACRDDDTDAIAAGPRLLRDGAVASFAEFDPRFIDTPAPRTAIGVNRSGNRVVLVVTDGRLPGYSDGATVPDLAALFLLLGAHNALNLDGGGSSTLVVRGPGGRLVTLNRPMHTSVPGRQRPVANHIGIRFN